MRSVTPVFIGTVKNINFAINSKLIDLGTSDWLCTLMCSSCHTYFQVKGQSLGPVTKMCIDIM
jgi:hypothetical protein